MMLIQWTHNNINVVSIFIIQQHSTKPSPGHKVWNNSIRAQIYSCTQSCSCCSYVMNTIVQLYTVTDGRPRSVKWTNYHILTNEGDTPRGTLHYTCYVMKNTERVNTDNTHNEYYM